MNSDYVKMGEARRLAGPSADIIKSWVRRGLVRGFSTEGGHMFIHRQSLLAHVAKLERQARRPAERELKVGNWKMELVK